MKDREMGVTDVVGPHGLQDTLYGFPQLILTRTPTSMHALRLMLNQCCRTNVHQATLFRLGWACSLGIWTMLVGFARENCGFQGSGD